MVHPIPNFPGWLRSIFFLGGVVVIILLPLGCGRSEKPLPKDVVVAPPKEREGAQKTLPKVPFVDITNQAGLDFTHTSGAFGKKLLPETLGAGVAVLDFDADGLPDLLFVNSCPWPGFEDKNKPAPTLALYRNKGKGVLENVTAAAGLNLTMYGLGVTVGDVNNDGFPDVFITGLGGNKLLRNEAGGKLGRRFVDVTAQAGDLKDADNWPNTVKGQEFLDYDAPLSFPSSAAFVDYNNDGHLDLFVCNYVTWSPKGDLGQGFTTTGEGRTYGPPKFFQGTHCVLYRNRGDGTFANVTAKAGIQVQGELGDGAAKALGVVCGDVDGDGFQDIIVANDTVRNFFFHNQGDGTFKEKAKETGVAYADGQPRGAMGIDFGEYRTGRFGIVIGNFANEPNTLFRVDGPPSLLFADVALIEGLAGPSRIVLKFGLFFFDFDLDGLLDFLSCNGHLEPTIAQIQAGQSYKQPVQLYWNTGDKRAFEPLKAAQVGTDLFKPMVGRGCAYLDLDGDGDLDVVLTENGGPARLLRNDQATGNHWLRLDLVGNGQDTNTSAIGAKVTVHAGSNKWQRQVQSARGYLSQSELTLTLGLGTLDKIDRVEITWPNRAQQRQVLTDLAVDKTHTIKQAK